jgi:superfamily II DNA/RNA helicase
MTFSDLGLSEDILRAVADTGYSEPTPIQAQAIPFLLMGRDILACAQTGTGKTASFTLPMIDILAAGRAKARMPRSLILEPTRELAAQVADNFETYGKYHSLNKALIIGGEPMAEQVKLLDRGVDVLIATPGRLLDVFDRGHLVMNAVKILVIDEADRMLDMGFIPDVERIMSLVSRMRQTLLFSATMPPEIRRLVNTFMINPKEIIVSPPATPAETVSQGLVVVAEGFDTGPRGLQAVKRAALRRLIETENVDNALIFCNRKREVGILQRSLARHGFDAAMLHGDMVQSARTEVLARYKRGEIPFLVCSDVAARGLDIAGVSHVFNFDVPVTAEDYIHRIGRTGRAGRVGRALTVAMPEDGPYVAAIETLIGRPIPRMSVAGIEMGELVVAARRGRRRKQVAVAAKQRMPKQAAPPMPRAAPPKQRAQTAPASGLANSAERARTEKPMAQGAANPHPRPQRSTSSGGSAMEKPIIGMGDHVPAFLLRVPKISDKGS